MENNKRRTLRQIGLLAPTTWLTPIITSVTLPAHALTTDTEEDIPTGDALINFPVGSAVFFNSLNPGNGETNLGAAAAGNMGYSLTQSQLGSYLRQNLAPTGVCMLTGINLSMQMNDRTDGTNCPSQSTNNFEVEINGTTIGTFSFETVPPSVLTGKAITVGGFYSFASIAGTGANADEYEVKITATTSRCGGGGSWQWSIMGTVDLFGTPC